MWRVPTSRRACYNHGESIAVGSANKAHTTLTVQHTHTPRTYQRRGRLSASRGTRAGEGMSAALSCAFIKTPLHHEVSKLCIYGHHSDEEDFPGTHSPCSKYGLPSNTMALISPSLLLLGVYLRPSFRFPSGVGGSRNRYGPSTRPVKISGLTGTPSCAKSRGE